MLLYDYQCENCKSVFENIEQSIKDEPLRHCLQCGMDCLERVIHVPILASVRQEVTTIGQLSERNAKKIGRYEIQERTLKDKDSKKEALKSAKKELHSKINKMSDKQKQRYIENG